MTGVFEEQIVPRYFLTIYEVINKLILSLITHVKFANYLLHKKYVFFYIECSNRNLKLLFLLHKYA